MEIAAMHFHRIYYLRQIITHFDVNVFCPVIFLSLRFIFTRKRGQAIVFSMRELLGCAIC